MTCQFCGEDGRDDNSYMLRPDLSEKVIGKPYHYDSGWACLGCVAERLFPYQLRNEDFTDGPGEDELHKLNPRIIQTFDGKYWFMNFYNLIFPDEGGDTVQLITSEWCDWPDQYLLEEMEYQYFDWLWDYCCSHKLRLVCDDDEMYNPVQDEPASEGLPILLKAGV
jgi:hypothetical protein